MKKTKLFAVLLCLVLTIASFGFVACNNTNDTQTTHNYSQEWSFDKENHFHKCTDEGCTEVSEKAAHTIENGACTVCGYENEQSEAAINAKYLNFVTSVTEMKAEEGYTASIKDANVTVKNLPVEIIKDEKSNCETIDTNLIVTANIELFVGKDAKGEFTLKAHAVLDGVVKNADATKQKAYADVVTTANASATLVAESGKIYAHVTAETKYDGIPEEYKPYNTADTFDLPISMTYEDFINLILSMAGNDSDSIGSPDVNPAQMLISYAEKVFGAMGEILSVVDVDRMKAVAVDYIKRVINLSYNVTETENGYTVALDFNKVADVLNDFADLKASEFLNKYVMDGGYDDFCNAIINALDYNVEFIVNSLDKAGIDINEIVAKINANL